MSYLKKSIILMFAFLIIGFLAYQFAIKKTLNLKSEYKIIKLNKIEEKNIKDKIVRLKTKKNYLDSLITSNKITTTNLQNELLVFLNTLSDKHKVKLSKFTEPHVDSIDGVINTYYQFSLVGNYKQIIRSIYDVEYDRSLGQLVSLQLIKQKNYRRNTVYLTANVLMKNTQ